MSRRKPHSVNRCWVIFLPSDFPTSLRCGRGWWAPRRGASIQAGESRPWLGDKRRRRRGGLVDRYPRTASWKSQTLSLIGWRLCDLHNGLRQQSFFLSFFINFLLASCLFLFSFQIVLSKEGEIHREKNDYTMGIGTEDQRRWSLMSFLKTRDVSRLGYIRNNVGHFCVRSGLVSVTADVAVESLLFPHRTVQRSVSLGFSPLVGSMALPFSGSPRFPSQSPLSTLFSLPALQK